jgi:putative glutamine amidotransferase
MERPRIVVTLAVASRQKEPEIAARKNELYLEGIRRHGGEPVPLDAATDVAVRDEALRTMDGLLLSGGADIEPSRYGQPNRGSVDIEPDRDALEAAAWAAAAARSLPVLGICRGFQAINVLSGGGLLQDVAGHAGAAWGHGPAKTHATRLVPGTRLARVLSPARVVGAIEVNTYHHQGVRASDLAPGLVASAWASSPAGDLVEGVEAADGRFLFGVQCHPERQESTPAEFERLWAVFVDACRGPIGARDASAQDIRPAAITRSRN